MDTIGNYTGKNTGIQFCFSQDPWYIMRPVLIDMAQYVEKNIKTHHSIMYLGKRIKSHLTR